MRKFYEVKAEKIVLQRIASEWRLIHNNLKKEYKNFMTEPGFSLSNMYTKLAYWNSKKYEIKFSRKFLSESVWHDIIDVLRHEMAHQLADAIMTAKGTPDVAHGVIFKECCKALCADPAGSTRYERLTNRVEDSNGVKDKTEHRRILDKIEKLLALSGSNQEHEANSAMIKAHELMLKHNIDVIETQKDRTFGSIYLGDVRNRRRREDLALSRLLRDFYFVKCIWVYAYQPEEYEYHKKGYILEINGTMANLKIAQYIWHFIQRYIDRRLEDWRKETGIKGAYRSNFGEGVIEGFSSKLHAEQMKKEKEAEENAIVTLDDPLLEEYYNTRHPKTVSTRMGYSNGDGTGSYDQGFTEGRKMVIHKGVSTNGGNRGRLLN